MKNSQISSNFIYGNRANKAVVDTINFNISR